MSVGRRGGDYSGFRLAAVAVAATVLVFAGCGSEEDDSQIIFPPDRDAGDTDGGPDGFCDDPENLTEPECVDEFCAHLDDQPDQSGGCSTGDDCPVGYECLPDRDYQMICEKTCFPEACSDVCESGNRCEPRVRYGHEVRHPDNDEIMGGCQFPPGDRLDPCVRHAHCGEGQHCINVLGTASDEGGQCEEQCDPDNPSCDSIPGAAQVDCVRLEDGPGTCTPRCTYRGHCPLGMECVVLSELTLGICVRPEMTADHCIPEPCEEFGGECGSNLNNCDRWVDCGGCPDGEACAELFGANECRCVERTCEEAEAECGEIDDGCGGTVYCGACYADGSICGENNQCVCDPLGCEEVDDTCGTVDDGCGGTIDCGGCPSGETCDEEGSEPNSCVCEAATSCESEGVICGEIDDGCGNTIQCDECDGYETCGGGGEPGECGCTPTTCADEGVECGQIDDGCGNTLDCGDCPDGYCSGGVCEEGCDPVDQFGCPASDQRCVWDGGEVCTSLDSSPLDDGEQCNTGECDAGSICATVGGTSLCRSYCYDDNDCSYGASCQYDVSGADSLGVCTLDCDPLSPDITCEPGVACYVLDFPDETEVVDCFSPGSGNLGSYCSDTLDCGSGMACVASECQELCEADTLTCESGTEWCESVNGWNDYGTCP